MSEWQDISTAPKDGTDVLVFCPVSKEVFCAHWFFNGWTYAFSENDRAIQVNAVTHWMRPPSAPSQHDDSTFIRDHDLDVIRHLMPWA